MFKVGIVTLIVFLSGYEAKKLQGRALDARIDVISSFLPHFFVFWG